MICSVTACLYRNWDEELMSLALILITSIILGALRIGGEKGEIFQAVAHLRVGGLFVAGTLRSRSVLWIAIALSVLELACFLVQFRH